ncbi:unnamed protein product [Discula destructiva]
MTSRASPHPPSWRLWHPTNGILIQPQQQQPLYPALDVARFFTEASSSRAAEVDSAESVRIQETRAGLRSDCKPLRQETRPLTAEEPSVQATRAASDTHNVQHPEETSSKGAWAKEETSTMEDISAGMEELSVQGGNPHIADTRVEREISNSPQNSPSDSSPHEASQTSGVPFTPLEYKMSHETFQAARVSQEGSAASYWSYSFYRGPNENDDNQGKVRVHYCRSSQAAETALQHFVGEKWLGLDLEWSPQATRNAGIRKNISLVQIASQSRVILMHLALYPVKDEFVTPTMRRLLEDPEVTKLGVWINGDCTRLRKFLGIDVRGRFELSHLFKQVKYSASRQPKMINKRLVSLATQVQDIMGLPMKKDQNVRASDWSQPLDMEQIGYSASDAYAAVQLFAMLNHQRENLDPMPALPLHAELGKPIPVPPGLEPLPEEEALAEYDIADEKEIEAATEFEAGAEGSNAALPVAVRLEDLQVPAAKARTGKASAVVDKAPLPPKDPRVETAEVWLAEFRAGRKTKASPSALRAYHIWHTDQELDCVSIAKILRNPPLQTSSVASYILASVQMERLPYDKVRMKTDVLASMPEGLARKRFFPVWQAVNASWK